MKNTVGRAYLRILQLRIGVDASITDTAVQAIHNHREFDCMTTKAIGSAPPTLQSPYFAHKKTYALSADAEHHRRTPFSADPAASRRPARSRRRTGATVGFAPACP